MNNFPVCFIGGLIFLYQVIKYNVKVGLSCTIKLKKMHYHALVESNHRFAIQVWGGVDQKYRGKLEAAKNSAVRAVSGMRKGHSEPSYAELQIPKLKDLIGMEWRV